MNLTGFIDLHTHGFGRYDTRTTAPDDILRIAALHGEAGTAAVLLSIYPGPITVMRGHMAAVKKAMEAQRTTQVYRKAAASGKHDAVILGVHLEGPFLNPVRCGALDKGSFERPHRTILRSLIDGYEDIIKIITIAPELPGALRIIEQCCSLGIRVNMGHSDATYRQAHEGSRAGATGITHLFNAMRPFHHREPGLAGFGLLDDAVYVEIIPDGIHLHNATLSLVFNVKNHSRILLVSDSVKGAGGRGKAVYTRKGSLAGSGRSVAGSVEVLSSAGVPSAVIMKAGMKNPRRYLFGT